MMGMSSVEWSRYMAEELGVPGTPDEINAEIVERMLARYGESPPLIDGAVEAVRMAAGRWPLAIASSSNPELIEVVLRAAGLRELFPVTVSSQEVPRESPRPTCIWRQRAGSASRRTPVSRSRTRTTASGRPRPRACASSPSRISHFPPDDESLAQADVVVGSVTDVTPDLLAG